LAITEADILSAVEDQFAALEKARDVTAAYRDGKATDAQRIRAMIALEEADALLLDMRRAMILQAAKVLGATVRRGRRT
jgi:hypothetical protein